jgi:hypothetical protein
MNAVDIVQLNLFLAELADACVIARDHRAEEAIRHTLERQPDAAYLLVQRVMQLESALCGACAAASGVAREPRAADASEDRGPTGERGRRDPWWRQPNAGFAGTAFLIRSTEYLLGDRP